MLWIDGVLIGIFCIFVFVCYVDAEYIRINHYFLPMAIFGAMFGILDVLSDVLFAVTLIYQHEVDDRVHCMVIYASWTFILLPILLSLWQLVSVSKSQWAKDDAVRRWIVDHVFLFYALPVVCGSAFVAVSIVNCEALQLKVFTMGLSKNERMKFNAKRIWTVVFLEVEPHVRCHVACSWML